MDEDAGLFLSHNETDEIKHWQNQDQIFKDIFAKRLWPDAFPRLDKGETKNILCLGIATRTLIGRSRNTNGVPALESRKTVSSLYSRLVCLLHVLKCYVMEWGLLLLMKCLFLSFVQLVLEVDVWGGRSSPGGGTQSQGWDFAFCAILSDVKRVLHIG